MMKELLKKIGIINSGHFESDGSYVIEFDSSDSYNVAFSKLDRSEDVEENPDGGAVTLDTSVVVYENDNYILQLVSNFNDDTYKLIIREVEN